jgi:nucleoside-diphosphate-sugar epimerase
MDKLKILIGGGAGYIGSALVPELLKRGHEVTVIDTLWFGNTLPREVRVIAKNLFDCTEANLAGYDQFIFLAGLSNDPMAEYDPVVNFTYNGALPSFLAYIAKRAGIRRFIYASSCSVYGFTVNELYDEQAPTVSNYPYGISKLQGERGVLQLQDQDFSVIALRQGTVSGCSSRMRFDLIVNTMFKAATLTGKITVNNPRIWRPVFSIQDAVAAYVASMEAPPEVGGVFNVTTGNYTVGEVAEIVKTRLEALSGTPIEIETKNLPDMRNYKVSIAKAKTLLGYEPRHSVEGIVDTLFAGRAGYGDFRDERFYNIEVFKKIQLRSHDLTAHAVA